jgi:hypothetical protein|tara:strand:+ start:18 stop:179 length:162 start_codon:yes stop_codon:yes gene_type:complete
MINIISFLILYAIFCLLLIFCLAQILEKKYQKEINRLHVYYHEKYIWDLNYAI